MVYKKQVRGWLHRRLVSADREIARKSRGDKGKVKWLTVDEVRQPGLSAFLTMVPRITCPVLVVDAEWEQRVPEFLAGTCDDVVPLSQPAA